jgi:hypothetical protein
MINKNQIDPINNWSLTTRSLAHMSKKQQAHRKRPIWDFPKQHKYTLTKITKHDNCEVEVRPGQGPHHACLYCLKHNKVIQHLSKHQTDIIQGVIK